MSSVVTTAEVKQLFPSSDIEWLFDTLTSRERRYLLTQRLGKITVYLKHPSGEHLDFLVIERTATIAEVKSRLSDRFIPHSLCLYSESHPDSLPDKTILSTLTNSEITLFVLEEKLQFQDGRILEDRSYYICCSVAMSMDCKFVVNNGINEFGSMAKIWNAETGAYTCLSCEGQMHGVRCVEISLDGKRIATGDGNTVRVWDVATGLCIAILRGHTSFIQCVKMSANGSQVASCDYDGDVIRVWDVAREQCIAVLNSHSNEVYDIAMSADGSRIASCGKDKTIRVWDVASRTCIVVLEGHTDHVYAVAISEDGTKIVSGSIDKTVRVWDAVTGVCTGVLKGHTSEVTTVAITPNGAKIVSGSRDTTVRVWNAVTGACNAILNEHLNCVDQVAISADGRSIASISEDMVRLDSMM